MTQAGQQTQRSMTSTISPVIQHSEPIRSISHFCHSFLFSNLPPSPLHVEPETAVLKKIHAQILVPEGEGHG